MQLTIFKSVKPVRLSKEANGFFRRIDFQIQVLEYGLLLQ